MKFIKKNKFSVFIMIIFTAVVIFATVAYNTFFVGKGAVYGDRLEGIEEVPIKSGEKEKLVSALKEKETVKEVTTTLHGKIFNVIITVNDDISKDNAKKIGNEVLNYLTEEQLDFYDVQVYIKKEDEAKNDFPIVGYKQNTQKNITWSKDRQVSEK